MTTGVEDITTWVEGKESGEKHYNNYGDVIIFKKNGHEDAVPVIHRVVVWLRVNDTHGNPATLDGYSYDIPSLGLYNRSGSITIPDYPAFGNHGDEFITLTINLAEILKNSKLDNIEPQSGYVTKGDWNHAQIDQEYLLDGHTNRPIGVVRPQWIIGKARFELPWFGLIKLFITGKLDKDVNPAPKYSWLFLGLTLAIIIASVIALDFTISFVTKRVKKKVAEEEDAAEDEKKKRGKTRDGGKDRKGGREPRGKGPPMGKKPPGDKSVPKGRKAK
jgi:signal peptidase